MRPEVIRGLSQSVARLVFEGEPDRFIPHGDHVVEARRDDRSVLIALQSGSGDLARSLWRTLGADRGPSLRDVVILETASRSRGGSTYRSQVSQDPWSTDALAHLGVNVWRYGGAGEALERRDVEVPVIRSQVGNPSHRFPMLEMDDSVGVCQFFDGSSLEYLGLTVAIDRVGSTRYEVGVSERDREARSLAFGELYDRLSELTRTLREVRARRVAGSTHPLAQAAPERWLRHHVLRTSELGVDRSACVETGSIGDERRRAYAVLWDRLAVMTVGPDPGLLFELGSIYESLCRMGCDLSGGVTLYMPGRDRIEGLERLLERSTIDINIVTVAEDWQRQGEEP